MLAAAPASEMKSARRFASAQQPACNLWPGEIGAPPACASLHGLLAEVEEKIMLRR